VAKIDSVKIVFRPIGKIDDHIMAQLAERLGTIFGCPTEIVPLSFDLTRAYDARRGQYHAASIIDQLKSQRRAKDEKVLGIVDVDLYAPHLNFVFGQADIASGTAVISLCRLRQEFYGLPEDRSLLLERATKEAVHELGHLLSLGHCPETKCVMHFSNSLDDTDWKQAAFCNRCQPKLIN